MKRTIVLLFVLAGTALPAFAAKRVTVAQFEQAVAGFLNKPDAEAAFRIADMQLTERLTAARIQRLSATLPGNRSREALTVVADASEFQPPAPEEIPARATPDVPAQRRILSLAVNYVGKTIPQLPNFFATRLTNHFEDTPLQQGNNTIPYQPLHPTGNSTVTVLYRDGREVEEALAAHGKRTPTLGLATWGEFGPILGVVLVDAAQSKLAWSRWEQEPEGLEAVFSYDVPKEKSHYQVNYCCVAEESATIVADVHPFRRVAGYRGEMAVDPVSGAILRVSVKADLKPDEPVSQAEILVDYGPVEIGGKTYICPVKSVSITTAQMVQHSGLYKDPLARQLQPLKTMLNDVKFEQYHVFRAESRVLTAEAGAQESSPGNPSEAKVPVDTAGVDVGAETRTVQKTPDSGAETSAIQNPANASAESGNVQESNHAAADAAPPLPTPAPAEPPEISITEAADVPDAPALAPPAAESSGFTLRTTTRLVDVGLVAYDKKGRPVTDLKQSDFEIYDNGRRQEVKYFGQAGQGAPEPPAPSAQPSGVAPEPVFSNRQTGPILQPRAAASESHATILLIDAANVSWGDLAYARQEMLRFLKTVASDERVGVYILRSRGFQILLEPTGDHEVVASKLRQWMPTAQDLARAQDEEQRNRQSFDYVHSVYDLPLVNGNESADPSTYTSGGAVAKALAQPTDARLRSMGSNPEPDSLQGLEEVGRHLAAISGHKNLVWVTSDNVLVDWTNQASAKPDEQGMKFIHSVALHIQETLNEAHVSIYPLDSSQLEAGGIGADIGTRNVLAVGLSDRDQATAVVGDAAPLNKPGRITAQMHQDTHPIQPEFRELAEATGGRALRRAGDIAGELNGIAEDGRAAYLLSFSPDMPADDKYHLLTVKLAGRRDLTLRYRTGYLYEEEPVTLRQRFQRAVWQPRDVNDIGVSATPTASGKVAALKLTIAATDLAMAEAGDRWTDKLDVFIIERDDSALHAKVTGTTLGLRLQPATYQKALREGITLDEPLPAKSSAGSIRIVVVDQNSGRMGSVTIPGLSLE